MRLITQKQEADLANHYYGGSKWVDPTDESIPKLTRVLEDSNLTKERLHYSPRVQDAIDNDYPSLSIDEVRGTIKYNKEGMESLGQLEDFEKLLLRRVPKVEVEKVMQYLRKKTNSSTHIECPGTDIFLDNNRYMVRLEEMVGLTDKGLTGEAYSLCFNIWYMDPKWQKLYKEYYEFKSYLKIR